jgi:leucyl aminopeptidase
MTARILATEAEKMANEFELEVTIFNETDLERMKMDAFLGVNRGSAEPPRLIVLKHDVPESTTTLALVGKGVTFDTGGITLKSGPGMHEMKFDMCGAAAVLGAMRAIAQMNPQVNVVAAVPASDNKPGPNAQVPGDIVRAYNGKTIEIYSTDAEGRMLLADTLAYIVDQYKPDAIVDIATLTGACIYALGHYAAALLGNNDELEGDLELAAEASGDRVWPLPLWDEYGRLMKGVHADLNNAGPRGEAGTITAAAFLQEFVGDTPWAHLDIAGTAWDVKHVPYLHPDHATGFGVRLFTQWVMDVANDVSSDGL